MWIAKVRKHFDQQMLASSFVLEFWTGPGTLREVLYRDPYGFGKATRVGEAANPGPVIDDADDAMSFEEQLALEDSHVDNELVVPVPDDLLPDIFDQARESVLPRPPREVAPEAVPPAEADHPQDPGRRSKAGHKAGQVRTSTRFWAPGYPPPRATPTRSP